MDIPTAIGGLLKAEPTLSSIVLLDRLDIQSISLRKARRTKLLTQVRAIHI
jgi:hypothetical protein